MAVKVAGTGEGFREGQSGSGGYLCDGISRGRSINCTKHHCRHPTLLSKLSYDIVVYPGWTAAPVGWDMAIDRCLNPWKTYALSESMAMLMHVSL